MMNQFVFSSHGDIVYLCLECENSCIKMFEVIKRMK